MSVVAPQPEQRFVWHELSWDQYESLLDIVGNHRMRHTYVEGSLEILSPSMDHEAAKSLLGDFVATLCRISKLPRKSMGSTTIKKERWRRGLEPDEGFYIGEDSVARMQSRREFDPDSDPPPDLIVEVDVTASSEDRIEFYRQLGVPEVWRYTSQELLIHGLTKNGRYRRQKKSRIFSFVTAETLTRFLAKRDTLDDTTLELEFEAWATDQLHI